MKKPYNIVSRSFTNKPNYTFYCPACKKQTLSSVEDSFSLDEPKFSKDAHDHEEWDPDWITYRFTFKCVCRDVNCGEISWAAGSGYVDQQYDFEDQPHYFDNCVVRSIFPAPYLTEIPEGTPEKVENLIAKSFDLYWVSRSAAANSLRASLEMLLDDLGLAKTRTDKNGKQIRLNLHSRIEIWAKNQPDNAELCLTLKEVGNIGSHGEHVSDDHYFGSLALFMHVLKQLYNNDAEKMKKLAKEIKAAIKGAQKKFI